MKRDPYAPDIRAILRAALERGPLLKHHNLYRYGRRTFAAATVNAAVDAGEAKRLPDGSVIGARGN